MSVGLKAARWRWVCARLSPSSGGYVVCAGLFLAQLAQVGTVEHIPSAKVLRWPKIIAPEAKEILWEYQDGAYEILALNTTTLEEFQFEITEDGQLLILEYDNERTGIEEKPDELVLEGQKREIPVGEVPKRMLETVARLFPDTEPDKAWHANTLVGPRYVVQIGNVAFYATPDGRIHCGGAIDEGALDEIEPSEIDF